MPSAQSVPLARVICESLWSAAAARSGAPLRVAASMSSTTAQLAGASAREPWLACSAAASACSCLAETVVQHRRGPLSPGKPGALLAALCLSHAGLDQLGGLGFPAPQGGQHPRRVRRPPSPRRLAPPRHPRSPRAALTALPTPPPPQP